MNKINFRRRVKTLLENKNNNFKRKYFLLSLNSVLKESNHDKFVAYADVLFKSNGNYPSEEALYSYLKESSLKEKKIHYIKNYLNLLYSNKKNLLDFYNQDIFLPTAYEEIKNMEKNLKDAIKRIT